MALSQSPSPMPFVFAAEFVASGRKFARTGAIAHSGDFHCGKQLELLSHD
jgi:hypothetical protein